MNLILFPESSSLKNGYGIAVDIGYEILAPTEDDLIIWYTNDKDLPRYKDSDFVLSRPGLFSFQRLSNMLLNKLGTETDISDFRFIKGKKFNRIHCDDVVFYRAIRKLFPDKQINVRFHNCFSRILDRKRVLGMKMDLFFELKLRAYAMLEREIFKDKKCHKIFISDEDLKYYVSMTGCYDATVWPLKVDDSKGLNNRHEIRYDNKLIWIGGVQDHKKKSMIWFINEIFPKIRSRIPDAEFHLWGMNTLKFNSPDQNIYGHGFYSGSSIPFKDSGLFVNPDIIGGGVKLKIKTYFELGVPFITTPFGFEGYSQELVDGKYCIVVEMDKWTDTIIALLG